MRGHRMDALPPGSEGVVCAGLRVTGSCDRIRSSVRSVNSGCTDVGGLAHMACQAHCGVCIVHHQKILRHRIDCLHVRIVAAIALHVTAD